MHAPLDRVPHGPWDANRGLLEPSPIGPEGCAHDFLNKERVALGQVEDGFGDLNGRSVAVEAPYHGRDVRGTERWQHNLGHEPVSLERRAEFNSAGTRVFTAQGEKQHKASRGSRSREVQ
jgi:hypothetical protein